MTDNITSKTDETLCDASCEETALVRALNLLLVPLARLCLANGISFATAEEVLKRAFVQEADALQPGAPGHGKVSRISTATGINRREVTRITKLETPKTVTKQPLASEVLARWTTDHTYRNRDGVLNELKRLGPAPSFEALAQSITRDVHHRSLLDELIRLGLVCYDEGRDLVSLTSKDYVPGVDYPQMLDFLGNNVGDHLNAAVDNVLHKGNSHLEQAVFADELSIDSLEVVRPLVAAHWNRLCDELVPAITTLIEEDKVAGRTQNQRVRIGLYTFTDSTDGSMSTKKCQANRRFRKPALEEKQK